MQDNTNTQPADPTTVAPAMDNNMPAATPVVDQTDMANPAPVAPVMPAPVMEAPVTEVPAQTLNEVPAVGTDVPAETVTTTPTV